MKIKNKPQVSSSSLPGGSLPRIAGTNLSLSPTEATLNRRVVITQLVISPITTCTLPRAGRDFKIRTLFFSFNSGAANNNAAVILTFANNQGVSIVHPLCVSTSNQGFGVVTCQIGVRGDWTSFDGLSAYVPEITRQGTLPDIIWPAGYSCLLTDEGGGTFTNAVAAVEYYPEQT